MSEEHGSPRQRASILPQAAFDTLSLLPFREYEITFEDGTTFTGTLTPTFEFINIQSRSGGMIRFYFDYTITFAHSEDGQIKAELRKEGVVDRSLGAITKHSAGTYNTGYAGSFFHLHSLESLAEPWKDDIDTVKIALHFRPLDFAHASERLKSDRSSVVEILKECPGVFDQIHPSFQADPDIQLGALQAAVSGMKPKVVQTLLKQLPPGRDYLDAIGRKWWTFEPLLRRLSGVVNMFIATKGHQKILLIGEYHTTEFCTHHGMVPIGRLIHDYLTNYRVDFMVEDDERDPTACEQSKRNCAEHVKQPVNLLKKDNLNYLRILAPKRSTYPSGARVHFTDPQTVKDVLTSGNLFLQTFLSLTDLDFKDPTFQPIIQKIKGMVGFSDPDPEWFLNDEVLAPFVERCILELTDASRFFKCFRDRPFHVAEYAKAFVRNITEPFVVQIHGPLHEELLFYLIIRFFSDIYTVCRMTKTEPEYYENIVLYAGYFHALNCVEMLRISGYKITPVDWVKYNPLCVSSGGRSTRRPRREKRRRPWRRPSERATARSSAGAATVPLRRPVFRRTRCARREGSK